MRWRRSAAAAAGAAAAVVALTGAAGAAGAAERGPVLSDPGVPKPPAVHAAAWLVADLDTGAVLAARDPDRRLAPASTLKILTALTLSPRLDPASGYTARPEDAAIDGSKVGMVPGSRYRVDDLLHGLMLGSGNDAATALAGLAGGTARTAELMTERARALGALDTVVVNPSGLDARGQVSSPHDLAVLGRAALADRRLARIVATRTYPFPAKGRRLDGSRKRFQIQNHNRLLWNYRGTTGVKNGFTEAARASFVLSAGRGEHRYVVTMMHARPDAWRDGGALLDWAFALGGRARPVGDLDRRPAGTPTAAAPTAATTGPVPAPVAAAVAGPAPPAGRGSGPLAAGIAAAGIAAAGIAALAGLVLVAARLSRAPAAAPARRRSGSARRRPRPALRRRR